MAGTTSEQLRQSLTSQRPTGERMTWGAEMVTILLSTWFIAGLAVDGWAHNNLARLETFFTPWHALFYSGFVATGAWIVWQTIRRYGVGHAGLEAIPSGYRLGVAGLALFAVGGILDMTWHIVFGIETSIDALLSPTHLLLYCGVLLIVSSPFRAAWSDRAGAASPGLGRFFPVLMSATLSSGLTAFMFMYVSPFFSADMGKGEVDGLAAAFQTSLGFAQFMNQRGGLAAILLTTLLLFVPAILMLRRWTVPFGSFAILFGVQATLIQAITAFAEPSLIAAGFAGGLAADALARRVRGTSGSLDRSLGGLRVFALAGPMLLWSLYVLAVAITQGIGWEVEIWTGAILWSGLVGLGLSLLIAPRTAWGTGPGA